MVECADIDKGLFETVELPWRHCNLNEPLPFADASYDYVVSVAGLHRVYHPESVLSEFNRLLKPGGRLIIGLWNDGSLRRRLRFLTTGSIRGLLDEPAFIQTIKEPAANFRQPLLLPRVWLMLEAAGFAIDQVDPAGRIPFKFSYLFWLPFVWAAGLLHSKNKRRKTHCVVASTRGLLMSNFFIVVAQKTK